MTLLTVVIPVFNRTEGLRRAITSVIDQQADVEVIIADDGSSPACADEIDAIIEATESGKQLVRAIHRAHRGAGAARNSGMMTASGQFVMFLDSDDELAEGALAAVAGSLGSGAAMVCGAVRVVSEHRRPTVIPPAIRPGVPFARLSELAGSFVVRTEIAHAVDGYDEALRYGENTDFVLRLAAECQRQARRIASTDDILAVYHEPAQRRRYDLERFESAVHLLRRGRFDLGIRSERAKLHGIAAVNASRLGRYRSSVKHAAAAFCTEPGNLRHLARLAMACTGPIARRRWLAA
jgi:glycosyltransferase involved in cell wall biosynthesis